MRWLDRRIDEFIQWIRDNQTPISIGDDPEAPTYWRWFVWQRNSYLNLYLHNFLRDDAHDLHDHRMVNISFILQGSYFEERFMIRPTPGMPLPRTSRTYRPQHSLTFRLPSTPHRVVLPRDIEGRLTPSWSLFLGFPHWRNWGFWCPGKDGRTAFWRQHEDYAMSANPTESNYGRRGQGCGE